MSQTTYDRCRICGLQLDEPPWNEDGKNPSFNICSCCGTEYGYEDAALEAIKAQHEKWLSTGARWFSSREKPEKWNLEE